MLSHFNIKGNYCADLAAGKKAEGYDEEPNEENSLTNQDFRQVVKNYIKKKILKMNGTNKTCIMERKSSYDIFYGGEIFPMHKFVRKSVLIYYGFGQNYSGY